MAFSLAVASRAAEIIEPGGILRVVLPPGAKQNEPGRFSSHPVGEPGVKSKMSAGCVFLAAASREPEIIEPGGASCVILPPGAKQNQPGRFFASFRRVRGEEENEAGRRFSSPRRAGERK